VNIIKAIIKTVNKREFTVTERERPELGVDEILVKVEYCGVCGSDLHAANHDPGYEFVPFPIILGHEISGKVHEVGSKNLEKYNGKNIVILPSIYCGECEQCQNGQYNICENIRGLGLHFDGGMREYIIVKENQILLLPDELPLDVAALVEPFSVAMHAVNLLRDNIAGKKVLVQGCGIIGFFTAIIADHFNADVILSGTEEDQEHRLSKADSFNLITKLNDEISKDKFDFIFECSGSSIAFSKAVKLVKKGGGIIAIALYKDELTIPVNVMVRGEIDIYSSYASTLSDFEKSIEILSENPQRFKELISTYQVNEVDQAFDDGFSKRVLKPMISF